MCETEQPHGHGLTRRRLMYMAGGALVVACGPAPSAGGPAPTAAATAAPTASPAPSPAAAGILAPVTWYTQSAFRWRQDAKVVYVDSAVNPGNGQPAISGETLPADLILITHAHGDHFNKDMLARITGPRTTILATADVAQGLSGDVKVVKPGDRLEASGIKVEAVPAYNIVEGRLNSHPRARGWVGYVLELGGRTYYHAGDTDALPELASLKVDAAFVPISGAPFVMTPEEAGAFVRTLAPKVAVPMHFGFGPGVRADGDRFKAAASPIEVTVMDPVHPFLKQ